MILVPILLVWAIAMGVMAFTGSPRAVLVMSALWLAFLVYRIFNVSGPFASAALLAAVPFVLGHILATIPFYVLAIFVRRRLER